MMLNHRQPRPEQSKTTAECMFESRVPLLVCSHAIFVALLARGHEFGHWNTCLFTSFAIITWIWDIPYEWMCVWKVVCLCMLGLRFVGDLSRVYPATHPKCLLGLTLVPLQPLKDKALYKMDRWMEILIWHIGNIFPWRLNIYIFKKCFNQGGQQYAINNVWNGRKTHFECFWM